MTFILLTRTDLINTMQMRDAMTQYTALSLLKVTDNFNKAFIIVSKIHSNEAILFFL